MNMNDLIDKLGEQFGILAESNTQQLRVIAKNKDVAVGDLFVLPSKRGHERFYIFRTSQYANVMNRTIEIGDVARNKLTMPNANLSEDLVSEQLIELSGIMLGYSEQVGDKWVFHRPRRLPDHLSEVYLIRPDKGACEEVIRVLLGQQLGTDGIYIGDYLAGEYPLTQVPVYIPPSALSHHLGIFGRTGCGKSNTMMVLIQSMYRHNEKVLSEGKGEKVSLLAIDPHDEFLDWHKKSGGRGGLSDIVSHYTTDQRQKLVEPFYYLTPKAIEDGNGQARIKISRADIVPQDVTSIIEFSEQQRMFCDLVYSKAGEQWISKILSGDYGDDPDYEQFLESTRVGVQRRLSFFSDAQTKIFTKCDPEMGLEYDSLLCEIVCSLEKGRIITIDTTLISEKEQFLLNTTVARVLFALRKALKSSRDDEDSLRSEIKLAFGIDPDIDTKGSVQFVETLLAALDSGELPYLKDGKPVAITELPHINIVIEEAPSVLNPERIKFGSVFRDISRQGRKFQIGLSVISQQVTAIDEGILTQINTEITMALGNETERKEAIRNASADLYGFEKELQVMDKGQTILTASYRDVSIPVQAPKFDDMI